MGLFWRLLLAHFIGDFAAQSEWFFKVRSKYLARFYHGLVVGVWSFILCLPYFGGQSSLRLLFVLIALTLAHIAIDLTKIRLTSKLGYDSFYFFVADQSFHIATVYAAYKIANLQGFTDDDIRVIVVLTWIVFVLWGIPVFLHFLRGAVQRAKIPPYEYYKEPHHGFALWERGALFLAVALKGRWFYLFPFAIIPRIFILLNSKSEKIPIWDWISALVLALLYNLTTGGK